MMHTIYLVYSSCALFIVCICVCVYIYIYIFPLAFLLYLVEYVFFP